MGLSCNFPLNQSHWIVGDSHGMIYGEPVEHVMFDFLAYKMVVYNSMMGIEWEYHRENSEWLTLRPYFFRRSSGMMGLSIRVTILKWLNYLSIKPMGFPCLVNKTMLLTHLSYHGLWITVICQGLSMGFLKGQSSPTLLGRGRLSVRWKIWIQVASLGRKVSSNKNICILAGNHPTKKTGQNPGTFLSPK